MANNSYNGTAPMGNGRGYAQFSGTGRFNPGPPPTAPEHFRHVPLGQQTWQYPNYYATPMMQRSSSYANVYPAPRIGFGSGYRNLSTPSLHTSSNSGFPTSQPRGMSVGQGSGLGIESRSNSDAQGPPGATVKYANDCEIIVLSNDQQIYAEGVQQSVKDRGLKVDVMFLKPGINLTDFLTPIARSGVIFAVIISREEEDKRTANFYQFRGLTKPKYHTNVPVQHVSGLMKKLYNDMQAKEIGLVPKAIKRSFSRMQNEELLDDPEYDEIIRFLRDRKIKQNHFKRRTTNEELDPRSEAEAIAATPECQALQKRILAILENDVANQANKNQSVENPGASDQK